jgi:hypothetical protein
MRVNGKQKQKINTKFVTFRKTVIRRGGSGGGGGLFISLKITSFIQNMFARILRNTRQNN